VYTTAVLRVMSVAVLVKSANLMAFIGIIRPGGDTRVGLLMDIGPLWILGVPLAYLGTFVWGYSVVGVYMLALTEELAKLGFALWRIASRRWMKAVG
jgi:Na+-driven multidrug efflux pump